MNHFKGHEQAGFGGALKNIGMGSASVGGKLELHSSSQPKIIKKNCKVCGICVKYCAHSAIKIVNNCAEIDINKCVGCGQCIALCQYDAAVCRWDDSENMNCKIAEYAKAALRDKPHFHVNFVMNVSPECDCWSHNDVAIVSDIGIAASFDPVALDMACVDLVKKAPVNVYSALQQKHEHHDLVGDDKFKLVHPNSNWLAGLQHAEKIGLGTTNYELEEV